MVDTTKTRMVKLMSQINKLPNIHKQQTSFDKFRNVPKEYTAVAEGMETQFTNHLLNEMGKTIHSETPESGATKYYKSLMNYERAKIMAKSDNGLGLKNVILEQIVPHHMKVQNDPNAIKMYQREAGFIEGDEK